MPIEFRCTGCHRLLRTAEDATGKQAKCPECGAVMTIPSPGPDRPPSDVADGASGTPLDKPPIEGDSGGLGDPAGPGAGSPFGPVGPTALSPPSPPEGAGTAENPYESPSTYLPPGLAVGLPYSDLRAYAASRVGVPAAGLITVGVMGLGTQVLLLFYLGMSAFGAFNPHDDSLGPLFAGGVLAVLLWVNVTLSILILLGGLKMKRLESYGFALAGSLLALLPYTCCMSHPCCFPVWLLGMIFGVWGLVVLSDGQVKAAFRR